MSGQLQRETAVKQKLNPIRLELKDKNVLLVDDSIVRGTTSRQIIQTGSGSPGYPQRGALPRDLL
jgi:amidophosphoribosyltransferase